MELTETKNGFDMTKDRFHHTHTPAIDAPAMGTVELGAHSLELAVLRV